MEHFSDELFADVVRGINSNGHADLQKHLAERCSQCTHALDTWLRLQSITAREKTYCPPADAVRMVKLEFEARRSQNLEVPAKLVFDSLTQPALAGVRSAGAAAARQMVYEVEGMMVDLRFDRPPRSSCISLIGQVLDHKAPRVSLANAAVMLWNEKGLVLAETRTNGLGEFHLEFELQNRLRLSIQALAGKLIRIPLANLHLDHEGNEITDGTKPGYC
jgi:hypothetical protein